MYAPLRGLICFIAILATVPLYGETASVIGGPGTTASEHFAAGNAAFERSDYAEAREAFQAAIAAGIEGPAAHYNAAVAEYRLGDYDAAASSFRALGRQFPEFGALADYNRGLALSELNEDASARKAFEHAASTGDEQLTALALAMLDRLPARQASRWLRFLEVGFGHDDNVVLADPLGLPAGQSAASDFTELGFYADGPVSRNNAWTLATNAYLLDYSDAPEYDQGAIQLAATRVSHAGPWILAAGPRIGRSTIGGDGFEQSLGAGLEIRRPLAGASANLQIVLSFDSADEIDERFAYIAGDRKALALRFDKALARATLILDYRRGVDDRAGAGVTAKHDRYRLTWRRPWGPSWTSDLVLEYRDTTYDELDPVRDENRLQYGLRAQRQLGLGWLLNLRYGYADNDSSDPRYLYQRHLVAVGASRSF